MLRTENKELLLFRELPAGTNLYNVERKHFSDLKNFHTHALLNMQLNPKRQVDTPVMTSSASSLAEVVVLIIVILLVRASPSQHLHLYILLTALFYAGTEQNRLCAGRCHIRWGLISETRQAITPTNTLIITLEQLVKHHVTLL